MMTNNLPPCEIETSANQPTSVANAALEINRLHDLACSRAIEAMDYARKTGELLLEVKNSLKHGQFQSWVEQNCNVSIRQSQRYMNVALNKSVPIQELTLKNDTMSYLPQSNESSGIWKGDRWLPERGCIYLFKDAQDSTYWILPSTHEIPHFHICKHYSGKPMATDGFHWRYTVFADIDDEIFTSDFYVGTRFPLCGARGVDEVLKSYGLKDIKNSMVVGKKTANRFERPIGEPDTEHHYWDETMFDESTGGTPSEIPESRPHPTGTPHI